MLTLSPLPLCSRMIQVMGVLMGIDLQAFEREQGSNDLPENLESKREEIEKQTGGSSSSSGAAPAAEASSSKSPQPPKEEPKAAPAPATPEVEMKNGEANAAGDDEDDAPKPVDNSNKAEAEAEKAKGNALYMKRNFEPAIEHYRKAWDLHKDITYLNNLGACLFEQGNYDEVIKTCQQAVDEGRAMRADYKVVAKSYGRIGSAYQKKGDLAQAIKHYERSLTEHRTPEFLNKLREAERALKEEQRRAYIDPAKSEEERNRGNDLFKAGKFAEAVAAFTESIKRNPEEPKGYTNRASAYTKLTALPEALKDCDEAIKIAPTWPKAYIRKANVLMGMKEHTKALEALDKASSVDEGGANAREIQQTSQKVQQALYQQRAGETDEETLKRAQQDPEVAQLLRDPGMQQLLQSAQENPQVLMDAMKKPEVKRSIDKLIAAGVIKTR